jgi:hypothetical protein
MGGIPGTSRESRHRTTSTCALPPHVIVQGLGQAQAAGQGLSAVEAAHVGLVWRVARLALHLQKGGTEATFVDLDPWESRSSNQGQGAGQASAPKPSGLKEKVLKMSALVDQTDESELMPPRRAEG